MFLLAVSIEVGIDVEGKLLQWFSGLTIVGLERTRIQATRKLKGSSST